MQLASRSHNALADKAVGLTPDTILRLSDELEANRQSRKSAWATLQRLHKFLEATGATISIPEDRNFGTEGEAIESGLERTMQDETR